MQETHQARSNVIYLLSDFKKPKTIKGKRFKYMFINLLSPPFFLSPDGSPWGLENAVRLQSTSGDICENTVTKFLSFMNTLPKLNVFPIDIFEMKKVVCVCH